MMKVKLALTVTATIVAGLAPGLGAQTKIFTQNSTSATVVIPNNNLSGVAEQLTFSSTLTSISDVEVSLDIAGGYDGDYYAYLTYGTGFAVLLNREGSSIGNSYGSPYSGYNVTFSGSAPNGNINLANAVGGIVTGTWQPDGRNVSPLGVVYNASPSQTALLSSFDGLNPNGTWDLFIADISVGGQGSLVRWGLTVTQDPTDVPDNGGTLGLSVLGVSLLGLWSLRQRRLATPFCQNN
jgi:subtilisin-like proprotein convertase family protein